jgi:hypothetical protein
MMFLLSALFLHSPYDDERRRGTPLVGEELAQYNRKYMRIVYLVFGVICAIVIGVWICLSNH